MKGAGLFPQKRANNQKREKGRLLDMDLSLLQRTTAAMREEEEEAASQLSKRPKLSNFSVASLLASAQRPRSPDRVEETRRREEEEEEEMVKEEEDEQEMSDEESDVSVDSHGEEEAGMLYSSRLNDSSDLEGETHRSTSSPLSSSDANRPVSPPRSSEGLSPHPRLAMPTPLLGGRGGFPGLPPGVHLPPGIFPPGWHGLLPPPGLPNLFKSGEKDYCISICICIYTCICICISTCIFICIRIDICICIWICICI